VPGSDLGTVLAGDAADAALAPVASAAGLSLGEKTGVPGIRSATCCAACGRGGQRRG